MIREFPAENIYGHTKKLRFIDAQIDEFLRSARRPLALLDFGCGNGSTVSRYLIREGIDYHGVDFHQPSLEYARAHFGGPRAHFHASLPPDVRFDILVYADVLEHLPDPVAVLREHVAQLRPDGLLIGSVPNGYGPFEIEQRLVRWFRVRRLLALGSDIKGRIRRRLGRPCPPAVDTTLPYNHDNGHVQFYTRKSLRRTLQAAGLKIEKFSKGATLGAPISEAYLLGGERIARANASLADWLPGWAVSTWYFTAVRAANRSAGHDRQDSTPRRHQPHAARQTGAVS